MRTPPLALVALFLLGAAALPGCGGDESAPIAETSDELTSWRASYADLAKGRVPPTFDKVVAGVSALGPATLPHEAKALRKTIGELRDLIDVFSYAYGKKGPGDPWVNLRDLLDHGYETVGAFKDLFDVQGLDLAVKDANGAWGPGVRPEDIRYADRHEVDARRDLVLTWRDALTGSAPTWRAYATAPDRTELHERKAKDQSKFFWGGAGIEPRLDRSGLENLGELARALLERAQEDYAAIHDLEEVTSFDDHEQFHDLRKRVRSIVKVVDYFPELLQRGAADPLVVLRELVDRYGSINDKLTAHDLAREKGKKDERKKLAEEIEAEWKVLRKWQKHEDVEKALDALRKNVRKKA